MPAARIDVPRFGRSLPLVAHADPCAAWRAESPERLSHGVIRIESAIWSRENVFAQDAEVGVLAIEEVVHPREKFQALRDAIATVEIDHHVTGNRAARILIVLV